MTRTGRFLGGVTLGSLQLVLATAVGLWMTPFLLRRLGSETLGFWLVAQQLLGYLMLMDFGVTAVLPRETAYAVGRAGAADTGDLAGVIARARRAITFQIPIVIAATLLVGAWIATRGAGTAAPLLLVLAGFALLFPLRLYQSVLQGLQELPFLGKLQIASWIVMTGLTIALVLAGAGLWALVIGWVTGQALTAAAAWLRVRQRHRRAWPASHVKPGWTQVRPYLLNAAWVSVAQVAQVLLSGSDLLLVGGLLGAQSVVLYSCTSKVTTVLANHPQLVMASATPALSELWAAGRRERLVELVTALTLAMLVVSGLVACLTLALNEGFVAWWVGRQQFGGGTLTVLLATQLVLRHWNIALIYGLVAFGLEKRVSITNLVDGAVSVVLGLLLIPAIGIAGPVVGSLVAVVVTSLPSNLFALAARTEVTPASWVRGLLPWGWRVVVLGAASALLPLVWVPSTLTGLAVVAATTSVIYLVTMAHGLRRSALAPFVTARLAPLLPRLTWLRAA
ncbi:MAG: oligosaccharide flippase family protein [Vicinamibacteria bacterium]|nr:oligosaccharide flippase family protein [Vicinamibacteria bacterium]